VLAGQSRDRIPGQVALFRVVTRDYFQTIGARLREGRFFEISDRRSKSPVVIVNDSFANLQFPGRSPLGAQLKFGQLEEKDYWYTIIGVVKYIRDSGVTGELKPTIYLLHEQTDQWSTKGAQPSGIVVRNGSGARFDCFGDPSRDLDRRQDPAHLACADDWRNP